VFFAHAASAGLQNAITVPWEGDITKFHTAVAGTNIILKGVLWATNPIVKLGILDSLGFQTLATACGADTSFIFKLNGVDVGTNIPPAAVCSCEPGYQTFVLSGAALTSAWNLASPPTVEVIYPGGGYFSSAAYVLTYGGIEYTNPILMVPGHTSVSDPDLCDGSYSTYTAAGFDVTNTIVAPTSAAPTSVQYQWNPGDGSAFSALTTVSVPVGTPYPVSLNYTYSGSAGTPYVAWLIASDGTTTISNRYLVMLQTPGLDANVNIAIDDGLWWLYRNGTWSNGTNGDFQTFDGSPCFVETGYSGSAHACSTASAVQAFEINGSLQGGNWNQDPYAQAVAYGLNWILRGYYINTSYPMLDAMSITSGGTTSEGNPDANGNGIGIEVGDKYSIYYPIYQGGQVVDALVASGTPDASTGRIFTGTHVATFKDVVQDMLDMYSWGQYTGSEPFDILSGPVGSPTVIATNGIIGGWRYTWGEAPDNSTSQWAAIGAIAAQQSPWNCVVPSFVTNYDNNWCWYSFAVQTPSAWGKFGYVSDASLGYPYPPSSSTTPSGLVQLNNDGITTNDFRWANCEAYFQNNWDTGEGFLPNAIGENNGETGSNLLGTLPQGNFYCLYSFVKAHRTALPKAVVNFPNGFDWYHGNASHDGIAGAVSRVLMANSGGWPSTYWEGTNLTTSWAVIVLTPNLFSAGPVACFSPSPNPGFANVPISFDPTCSTDPNAGGIANLVKFVWNWGDGTADTTTATPDVIQHSFACTTLPCSYVVTLTVYDNSNPQLSASAQQTINITQPPHPPVAVPGGPYIVSLCGCDSLTLDGSGSFSPDVGLHQENCNTCPPDGITAYGWALTGVPYTYTASSDEIVSLGSGFTTYFPTADTYEIGLQVTDNAKKSFPEGSTSNLIGTAFTSVTVYNCGPTITATPGCQSIAISWNNVGATSYIVLTSTNGPNSGFTVATTVGAGTTTASVATTLGETQWIRVQAVTANGTTMSCAAEVQDVFQDCVCISDLTAQSKATIVQLGWSLVQGVDSYNVYRSTAPNVNMIPANRVATGVGTVHGLYVDGGLTNGKTYYYRISEVIDGVETCRSIEVSATPIALKR
jgi:hypothetical protein